MDRCNSLNTLIQKYPYFVASIGVALPTTAATVTMAFFAIIAILKPTLIGLYLGIGAISLTGGLILLSLAFLGYMVYALKNPAPIQNTLPSNQIKRGSVHKGVPNYHSIDHEVKDTIEKYINENCPNIKKNITDIYTHFFDPNRERNIPFGRVGENKFGPAPENGAKCLMIILSEIALTPIYINQMGAFGNEMNVITVVKEDYSSLSNGDIPDSFRDQLARLNQGEKLKGLD